MAASPCVLMAGGGTGGHLYPALAVAREIAARHSTARILFAGSDRPIERGIVARSGFPHLVTPALPLGELRRRPLAWCWRQFCAWREARRQFRQQRPDVVLSTGGYAAVPWLTAAQAQRIPYLLLEANVVPGRTTRHWAQGAVCVCVAAQETAARLPGARCEPTGLPVREEIARLADQADPGEWEARGRVPSLLVLGGSQGAAAVHRALVCTIREHAAAFRNWEIVIQTGTDDARFVARQLAEARLRFRVEPYFDDVAALYSRASLVVARAGAGTLAELACAGVASVLVPFPQAAEDHQTANARRLAEAGAAVLVPQGVDEPATARALSEAVLPLVENVTRRRDLAQNMRKFAAPHAARHVAALLEAQLEHAWRN